MWPDLVKFRQFGKSLQVLFGKFLTVYFLFGKMQSTLWQICVIIGLIFIAWNGQTLKKIQPSGHTDSLLLLILFVSVHLSVLSSFCLEFFILSVTQKDKEVVECLNQVFIVSTERTRSTSEAIEGQNTQLALGKCLENNSNFCWLLCNLDSYRKLCQTGTQCYKPIFAILPK